MRDNLSSDNPGIIDDTSDGDLGANVGEPQYGSLAESQANDLADSDINSTDADGSGDAQGEDASAGHAAQVDSGADQGADQGADPAV